MLAGQPHDCVHARLVARDRAQYSRALQRACTHKRARAHTHIHTRTHTHAHAHTRARTHTHTHAHTHTRECVHTHTHTHTHAPHTQTRAHTRAHTHAHTRTRTRARAHTHAHAHAHTRTRKPRVTSQAQTRPHKHAAARARATHRWIVNNNKGAAAKRNQPVGAGRVGSTVAARALSEDIAAPRRRVRQAVDPHAHRGAQDRRAAAHAGHARTHAHNRTRTRKGQGEEGRPHYTTEVLYCRSGISRRARAERKIGKSIFRNGDTPDSVLRAAKKEGPNSKYQIYL